MPLLMLILFIVSWFIPVLWLAFFACLIWFLLTGKARRTRMMRNIILNMIYRGIDEEVIEHVYFESARSYAINCGAQLDPFPETQDHFFFEIRVNGKPYDICISRWPLHGGFMITVEDATDPNSPHQRSLREAQRIINGRSD